jgi:hypothetical protein
MNEETSVKDPGEPLFTLKEMIVGALLFTAYAAILFSLDPQWVGWAGPLVFGGALYAADAPPVRLISLSPQETFEMASVLSLVSVFVLGLLITLRGEPRLGWLSWVWRRLRESGLRWKLAARALSSTRSSDSIEPVCERRPLAAGQQRVATTPQSCRVVRRDPGMGSPEDLQPLHREAVSTGSHDIL